MSHPPYAMQTMRETGADFTNTFRWLAEVPLPAPSSVRSQPSTAQNGKGSGPDESKANGANASASGVRVIPVTKPFTGIWTFEKLPACVMPIILCLRPAYI